MKRAIRIDTLQWIIGIYVLIRGVLMLMLPHKLNTHVFVPIEPYFPWLGTLQVLGGATLIAVATLITQRSVTVFAHLLAGAALLQAAIGHLLAGTWTAVFSFGILALGTAIAPLLPNVRVRPPDPKSIDFFALLMAGRMTAEGIILLAWQGSQFDTPLYDPIRPHLTAYGIAYLGGGVALLLVHLYPKLPVRLFQLTHLAAGAVLWSWTIGLGFPTWNSVLYFGGLGTLLGLLPFLSRRLRQLDPASLQTQLAVTLAGIVTLPLLFAVNWITFPQEQAVVQQALSLQQSLANALSEDIANYVKLHQAAVVALSKQPGLAQMSASEQQNLLQLSNQAYPDIVVFSTFDAAGNAIARSDRRPLSPSIADWAVYQTLRSQDKPVTEIRVGRVLQRPIFIFSVPIHQENGEFAGIITGAIEATRVAKQLIETGSDLEITAYLVDSSGRVIAHPDTTLVEAFTNYAQVPPVAKLLHLNQATSGGLSYWNQPEWRLAGFAGVPDLQWGVVVERPAATVLAAINARRDRDFVVLVTVATTALFIGSVVARYLTGPLTTLAHAADQLATGSTSAPLPQSSITEVAHLSNVFGAMRDHLAQRTAERDRTELERMQLLQRERKAREEAETANRIKDEFLAVLSHELRSPLNPILGWAQLLRSRKFSPQATEQALATIERNAKLQTRLIEDLLDVSRILQGKMVLNIAPVTLTTVIEGAIETVKLSAEAKSIQIQTFLDPTVSKISGDASRLQQIVWNLLSNAIKFTPQGGLITVRLERVDQEAQIQIQDTGQGIDPQFLPYVFEYFRQADGSTTRKFGGLGLGLAIVRHLTELHGGNVRAESDGEGLGATFIVKLPLGTTFAEPQPIHPPSRPALNLQNVRVLLVDDEADIRDLVAVVLQQSGAEVEIATSAIEALAALERSQPDILLSDIGMPEMDGYMLIRQVRNRPPTQGGEISAIALTAYAGEANHQQALAAGFQMHLAKPIDPETLVQAIAQLLSSKCFQSGTSPD